MPKVYYTPEGHPRKICPSCQTTYDNPYEAFRADKAAKDGLAHTCRTCRLNKEKQRASSLPIPEKKVCALCETTYDNPKEAFGSHKSEPDGLHRICKVCWNTYEKELRQKNPEERRAYHREYEQRENYKVHRRQYKAKQQQDPAYQESKRQEAKRGRLRHPLKARQMVNRRRAQKRATAIDTVDYNSILERDGNFCYICQSPILPHQAMHFDHVIPLSRKGVHSEENIKVTHQVCNQRKNRRLPSELTDWDKRGLG